MAQSLRILTEEEKEKLAKDMALVSEFKQNKFEKEAQRNWDIFYKRNTTKFFKDRHWTRREFDELINSSNEENLVVFEVGCGVGNFMFPLMAEDKNIYFYACDFSQRAVQFVKDNSCYDPSRCTVFHCDIVNDDFTDQVPEGVVDVATMIFVLSAIHPDKMEVALKKVYKTLKPGGCLLIRDYGLYDYAMLRFAPGHKLSENFYVRQDGTRAYYFSLDLLDSLMQSSGFEVARSEYIHRQTVNKKEGLEVPRIFVQGKFVKPSIASKQSSMMGLLENECVKTDKKLPGCSLQSFKTERTEDICVNSDSDCKSEKTGICSFCSKNQVSDIVKRTCECNSHEENDSLGDNVRVTETCRKEVHVCCDNSEYCDHAADKISKLSVDR